VKDRRLERGQAMVYMALVMAVMVGVLYATYDLARMTTAKMQAQTAADAAALAAAAVKVSVHNTRTVAYAAMTGEAAFARLKLAKAMAVIAQNPPVPGAAAADFNKYVKEARSHLKRMRRLREGLIAYNRWIASKGQDIVADAARVAYVANAAGLNDDSGRGRAANGNNVHLMDGPKNLVENGGTFKSGQFVGGINYVSENAGPTGAAGKTFVWAEPVFVPLGSGLLGGDQQMPMPSVAAAGPVPSDEVGKVEPGAGDLSWQGFGMPWYTPRLFPVRAVHGFPHEILH
jgi:hypothetical protein